MFITLELQIQVQTEFAFLHTLFFSFERRVNTTWIQRDSCCSVLSAVDSEQSVRVIIRLFHSVKQTQSRRSEMCTCNESFPLGFIVPGASTASFSDE